METEKLSNCCGAERVMNSDICSHCHEHAGFDDGEDEE